MDVIAPDLHTDERGWFARTYCEREFAAAGIPTGFPQANLSHNAQAGTLRGLHLNSPGRWESKVVRCVRGAIFDVVVDLRPESATFTRWFGVRLDAVDARALFVPEGFAHGFVTLVDDSDVFYMMGAFHEPEAATGFRWNDPSFAIDWPIRPTLTSARDSSFPDFDADAWRHAHDSAIS
jgi:dTDP-4-dehydrorhamnose 3,5-epimerase